MCHHVETTTRKVPIEVWDIDDETRGYRIAEAMLHTCVTCKAVFYKDSAWNGVHTALQPVVTHPEVDVYC